MKILLIGSRGQVGREIELLALSQHFTVEGFDLHNLDITNAQQVSSVFTQNADADVVINAAAYTAVDLAEDEAEKAFAINCDGVKNLSVMCSKYNIPLLHISTDYVFPGDKNGAYVESDDTDPQSVYGKSKLAGEKILTETLNKHIILRISWVFGRFGGNFVKTILKLAKTREEISVVGDQHGCPTAAHDVARVLLIMALQVYYGIGRWGVYHYCNKPVTTWHEFAESIVVCGRKRFNLALQKIKKITTPEYPTKAARPHNSVMSVQKIRNDYGIGQIEWQQYLQSMVYEVD